MNGKPDLRTIVMVIVLLLQLALGSFGYSVRTDTRNTNENVTLLRAEVRANEGRIRLLEQFAAAGDRWTLAQQMKHESEILRETKALWSEIAAIKVRIAEIDHRD